MCVLPVLKIDSHNAGPDDALNNYTSTVHKQLNINDPNKISPKPKRLILSAYLPLAVTR